MQPQPNRTTAREHARAAIEAALRNRMQELSPAERRELEMSTLFHYRLYCGRLLFPGQRPPTVEVH